MGSAALYHLAARGRRALGLEAFTPLHDRGSSHGESRIIRQAYFEDPAYVPLLLRAYELWSALEQTAGADLLRITGGLMLGAPNSQIFQGSVHSAKRYGLRHEILDAVDVRRRYPALHPDPADMALYEPGAGILFPDQCIRAHLSAAAAAGAEARFEEPVLSWAPTAGGVTVTTAKGRYQAERLVIAAGPWAGAVLRDLNLPLRVERQVLHWFAPGAAGAPFAPERLPIYVWEHGDGTMFYGFPALGEGQVKVAFHHGGETTEPETVRRTVDRSETEAMQLHVGRYLPLLAGAPPVKSTTCLYTNTPDDNFVIGFHPAHPQVSIAAGFSGHGFKFCAVVGEVMADLACNGETRHPTAHFSPLRFTQA